MNGEEGIPLVRVEEAKHSVLVFPPDLRASIAGLSKGLAFRLGPSEPGQAPLRPPARVEQYVRQALVRPLRLAGKREPEGILGRDSGHEVGIGNSGGNADLGRARQLGQTAGE